MKILFCHDGSKNADAVLEKVVSMFIAMHPEILLLSVVEEAMDTSSEHEGIFQSEINEKKETMFQLAQQQIIHKGLKAEVLIYSGGPKKTILKVAESKRPDFTVVTRRKEGNLLQKLYGSTSDFLVRNSSIPVLVFREI